MARISARLIGQKIGKSAKEVNKILETMGYIKKSRYVTQSGTPIWELTEIGKMFGESSRHPYSKGHIWDPEVAEEIWIFLSTLN